MSPFRVCVCVCVCIKSRVFTLCNPVKKSIGWQLNDMIIQMPGVYNIVHLPDSLSVAAYDLLSSVVL